MEENNNENKEEFKVDTEEIKSEAKETAQKIKESMKNTNIKEEATATKGFIKEMFSNPIKKIHEVANDNSGKYFKTSLILLIIWIVAELIDSTHSTIYYYGFTRVFSNILTVLKAILAPAIGILVYSIIVLMLNKNKKPLTTVIATVTITKIPVIIANIAWLLTIISSGISTVTSPFISFCSAVSVVLGFFGFKQLFSEESSEKFIKTYVLIQGIYYVCYIVIKLFGIYI